MMNLVAGASVFVISVLMSLVGRGGGNFYVPVLLATGFPVHQAAAIAQLILFATASSALLVFGVRGTVDWKLALVIDPPTDVMALVGGYFAHRFSSGILKVILAVFLVTAGFLMLLPQKERAQRQKRGFGCWHRSFGGYSYTVNLWIAIPITAFTGLIAGMVGISGGSFKIPLMVLVCGVPMRIAVGTSSAMVAATALAGFAGHAVGGDLSSSTWFILLLALIAAGGGLLGGATSLRTKPQRLKTLFALTTLAAAVFMIVNAWTSQ